MKIVLVDNGETTAVYHGFYKSKLCTYKTADGIEGLMEAIGVEIVESKTCNNPSDGKIVDPQDGFPYHLDNLPDSTSTVKKKSRKKSSRKKK